MADVGYYTQRGSSSFVQASADVSTRGPARANAQADAGQSTKGSKDFSRAQASTSGEASTKGAEGQGRGNFNRSNGRS